MLRPLRALRVFTAFQLLITRGSKVALGRAAVAILAGAGFAALIGALAVLDAERGADGANITSFGDALWWAGVTITTVGYGDRFPVTVSGRGVALAMMLVGISLIGAVTATVAAWFVGQFTAAEEGQEQRDAGLLEELAAVRAEVAELRQELRRGDPSS